MEEFKTIALQRYCAAYAADRESPTKETKMKKKAALKVLLIANGAISSPMEPIKVSQTMNNIIRVYMNKYHPRV